MFQKTYLLVWRWFLVFLWGLEAIWPDYTVAKLPLNLTGMQEITSKQVSYFSETFYFTTISEISHSFPYITWMFCLGYLCAHLVQNGWKPLIQLSLSGFWKAYQISLFIWMSHCLAVFSHICLKLQVFGQSLSIPSS